MDTVTPTLLLFTAIVANTEFIDLPKFAEPIANVTVPVGREAILVCVVEDLAAYKVAWLRVDTQTILTIHGHVITKNHRIGVTHSDHRTWNLHIREVRQTDRGWYMCQINTDPMKSQVGFLEVVVSPDILDYPTSTDMIAEEGANVTLRCAVSGYPAPNVTWRREGGELLPSRFGKDVNSLDGSILNIRNVNRRHMGPYLCIASNGVPPSVSKRMLLVVHFPPMVWIPTKIVTARLGTSLTLECRSEAYPKAVNYWTKGNGDIISNGLKYANQVAGIGYNIFMKLTINSISKSDEGEYRCISRNSLGEVYDIIQVTISEEVISTGIPRHKELKLEGSDDVSSASKARSLSSSVISVFLIFLHWIYKQLFYNKARPEVILMSNLLSITTCE